MIEQTAGATVITGNDIDRFAILALQGALKLEALGLTRRGQSALSIAKRRFGFKGNRARVMQQLDIYVATHIKPLLGRD